jgi:ribose transport system permease protein
MNTQPAKRRGGLFGSYRNSSVAIMAGIIGLLCVVIALTTSEFFTYGNLASLAKQISVLGLLAIGIAPIIIALGFDLSVGSVAALSIMTSGYVILTTGSLLLSILAGVLTGTLVGALNALLIEGIGLNAIIVTLATLTAVRGLDIMMVKENYSTFARKIEHAGLLQIGKGMLGGVPIPVVIFLGAVIVLSLVMGRTVFGRRVYIIGNNERAAHISGINTRLYKSFLYMLSGSMAGLAGVIALSRIGLVTSAVAEGWEFQAVTAVIIGGTSLAGGIGTVWGCALGVLIIGAVQNLMTLNHVSPYYQDFITGFIIILAVLIDRYFNHSVQE